MEKISFKLSKRNLGFLGFSVAALSCFVLISIIPIMKLKIELAGEIKEAEQKLVNQKQVADMLTTIDQRLEEINKLKSLPNVQLKALKITESSSVSQKVERLAHQNNLTDVKIQAIMPKSSINLNKISFKYSARGPLINLRSFMLSLLQVPYVGKIKKVEINAVDWEQKMDLIFTVRLS